MISRLNLYREDTERKNINKQNPPSYGAWPVQKESKTEHLADNWILDKCQPGPQKFRDAQTAIAPCEIKTNRLSILISLNHADALW
jgi:hypothetical protein